MKVTINLFLVMLFFLSVKGFAQITNTTDRGSTTSNTVNSQFNTMTSKTDPYQLLNEMKEPSINSLGYPVEGVIDAEKYIVGQGDLFSLGLYGFLNQIIPLVVSLEGTLVIPTVGEIYVNDLTLKEAKSKVINAVKKRYYSSNVSFTLAQPRTFLIQVSGLSQGTFPVTSLTRTSQVLSAIIFDTLNVQKKQDNFKMNENLRFSLRNIELKRKDGSIIRIDIYKYFITKDDKYNPTLKEGDLLKIPITGLNTSVVSIYGAVQLEGNYEYAPDDDLETLIGLGKGFQTNAEPDSILLYKPIDQSKGFNVINLSYDKDKNYKISVYDRIFVKYKTDYKKMISVKLMGEILRPGTYPITFKNTRLKEAVEMAGGFTNNAYLPLCIIFRSFDEEYTKRDTMEIMINKRANDYIISEKDKLNFEEDVRGRRNRVVVDFEKLFKENDESQNIVLQDKDIIYINDDKKAVYVYGQVQNEGYVPLVQNETAEYYIEKAGGYSLAAEKGDTRIIKFNSRGWYKPGDIEIRSGDFIYVPKKDPKSFPEIITIISQISGVILGILTTYILIKNTQ
jgi:protein involved in polysaccharide export with SLBB domain